MAETLFATNALANTRFFTSWWFVLCGLSLLALGMVLGFLRFRVTRVTSEMNLRFEERLAERTRIAQELHDTLLQDVISASMQLHVLASRTPADSPAKSTLEHILETLARVTEEGRNTVGSLRSPQKSSVHLGEAFSEVHREFVAHHHAAFRVVVEGHPSPLSPMIHEEVFSIGREALINAFRHAQAGSIEVELEYAARGLRVLVRDSGVGFDSGALQSGRDGHWGLSGMRERAKRIGAKLRVLSRQNAGTEVDLFVPGHIAFLSKPPARKLLGRIALHWKQGIGTSAEDCEL